MTTVATRFSPKELEYLSKIASSHHLYKSNETELSLGKALRELVRWCLLNDIDINKKTKSIDDDLVKMIEHIHIALPHLMYLSRLQTLMVSDGISDEKILGGKRQSIDYLNKVCGDFQNVQYTQVHFSMNDFHLKTTPSDKDKTVWKSPSI